MKGETVDPPKPKKKSRERIRCIEEHPRSDWFTQCKGPDGKPWWFLRLTITGLRTRIYGPFATRHRALLFLDRIIGDERAGFFDPLAEADNRLREYAIPERRFENRGGHYPIIEHELLRHVSNARRKGGAA
jgi:hypothetical protein